MLKKFNFWYELLTKFMIEMLLERPLPYQKARLENKLPAWSVGSLSQRIYTEALVQLVQDFCENEISEQKLDELKERIDSIIPYFSANDAGTIFGQFSEKEAWF